MARPGAQVVQAHEPAGRDVEAALLFGLAATSLPIYAHILKGVGQRAVDGAAELIALTLHSQQAVSG
jgi:hypothetical protein